MIPFTKDELAMITKKAEFVDTNEATGCRAAVVSARIKWQAAIPADSTHSYALKKGLTDLYGARLLACDIILPYVNTKYEVMTVQKISSSGEKRFQIGAPRMGYFCVLSGLVDRSSGVNVIPIDTNGPVFICEGWSTGCSIRAATGAVVIVAGDVFNLKHVTESLKSARPDLELVVAADNDGEKNGNPGLTAAIKIFEDLNVPFILPDFNAEEELSDWNDYAGTRGLEATKNEIKKKIFENKFLFSAFGVDLAL